MPEQEQMESRVKNLEDGMRGLRDEVGKLKDTLHTALLGSLDGKPGIMQTLNNSLEASRINSSKLDVISLQVTGALKEHQAQLEGLRLDKAKVTGIVVTCSALWAALIALLGLMAKFWK